MPQKSPLCGANLIEDEPCQQRFECCMALEFENPATFGADICLDNPEIYCASVKLWAASVLADTEALIQKLSV